MPTLERLTANLSGKPRYETLHGRRHLVVPLSMLVPGVLNGSKGPLLYPLEEIQRESDSWNVMPIVVNHPQDKNGNSVSARDPDILNEFGVGTVFGATVNGKLGAFGWLDEEKSHRIIPEEYARLERGEPVELSTGLFTDNIPVKNGKTDDGKSYVAVARNYRPDHLAILTSAKGACSIKDGCGMNVNEQATEATSEDLEPFKLDWDEELTENQLSHSDVRERLSSLLRERHGSGCEIVDVYDKSVVYAKYNHDSSGPSSVNTKYYEIGYTSDLRTGKVDLSETGSVPVARETRYTPVKNESAPKWYELIGKKEVTANSVTKNEYAGGQSGPHKKCKCGGTCEDCAKTKLLKKRASNTVVKNAAGGGGCGTGAGGFKPGNKCAGGKGGGGGGGMKGAKKDVARKPDGGGPLSPGAVVYGNAPGTLFHDTKFKVADGSGKGNVIKVHKHVYEGTYERGTQEILRSQLSTNRNRYKETDMALTKEQKEELIDNLITNEGVVDTDGEPLAGPWEEDDRVALNALPEAKLEALEHQRQLAANAKVDPDGDDEGDEDEDETPSPRKKATKNQQRQSPAPVVNYAPARKKTTDEWLSDAPDEIRSAVTNALLFEKARKEKLITNIRKRTEVYSSRELADMTVNSLEKLASAIATNAGGDDREDSTGFPTIPNYAGVPSITQNLGEDFSKEDLDMAPDYGCFSQYEIAESKNK